ncbi:MAG TPA: circadian clock KaiB family protein [Flavobacterium sp.]|nr:circadian clock KaiB family protein [Flavobacterium sp.]
MEKNTSNTISEKHEFMLFIAGMSPKSSLAIENLRKICDQHFPDNSDIQIIDINNAPSFATEYQIIAIPTLIRINPMPKRTILGDLSDNQKVLKILDIR